MKYYILDAYNLIHKVAPLERLLDQSLEAARDELIRLCFGFKRKRSDVKKIIIVFDGRSEFAGLPQESLSGLQIIFTNTSEDADDRIIQVLEGIDRSAHVYVVSDDNYVHNQARAHRATPLKAADFFNELIARTQGKAKLPASSETFQEKSISPKEARALTDEYRKHLGI
jgi:predicted RNA-binding protein with PIN domain